MQFQITKAASVLSAIALTVMGSTALSSRAHARPYAGYPEAQGWNERHDGNFVYQSYDWNEPVQQVAEGRRHKGQRHAHARYHRDERTAVYSGRNSRRGYAVQPSDTAQDQSFAGVSAPETEQRVTRSGRRARVMTRTMTSDAANAYASTGGGGAGLVDEARRYIGGNPTGRSSLWCGAFMDLILRRTGHAGGGNLARSYAGYGTRVSGPQVGAIAVMSRGRAGGHVGVVSGVDADGNPIIISGNHGHRVAEATYPRGRIYAYVMP